MIEYLWELWRELWEYLSANFDPARDTVDILLVALGIYWLMLLMRGTRAVQILVGLIVLVVANVAADLFNLLTMHLILQKLTGPAVIIIVILFQHDIRRALARVGRGFFRSVSDQQESQMLEEVVRAAQGLAQRRVGALIVLERETGLEDQIEAGTALDSNVSKELLISLFVPYSPLHDGAVVIQRGRISHAGCILPLTLSDRSSRGCGYATSSGRRDYRRDGCGGDRGFGRDGVDLGRDGRRNGEWSGCSATAGRFARRDERGAGASRAR